MSADKRKMGLLERADGLATTQARFTEEQGIRLYARTPVAGLKQFVTTLWSKTSPYRDNW